MKLQIVPAKFPLGIVDSTSFDISREFNQIQSLSGDMDWRHELIRRRTTIEYNYRQESNYIEQITH